MSDLVFEEQFHRWLAAYGRFLTLLKTIPPDRRDAPGACGTWSIKQIVDHLSGWHYEAIRRFAEIASGDPFDRHYEVDEYNALQVEARSHLSWELTVEDLRDSVDILRMQALDLPPDRASAEPRYADWIQSLTEDVQAHQAEIEAWLASARG